jgi:hypothetical protein
MQIKYLDHLSYNLTLFLNILKKISNRNKKHNLKINKKLNCSNNKIIIKHLPHNYKHNKINKHLFTKSLLFKRIKILIMTKTLVLY